MGEFLVSCFHGSQRIRRGLGLTSEKSEAEMDLQEKLVWLTLHNMAEINRLPEDVLAMILRCAIDKQQDHVISIEAVCSRWQELIDKYCLWKDVAENYLNTSELWKNQLNTKVVERMIEDAKKRPKMERNEKYKEALKYSQFFENAFLQHLKKTY